MPRSKTETPVREPGTADPSCETCRGDGAVPIGPGLLSTRPCPACQGTFWRPPASVPEPPPAPNGVEVTPRLFDATDIPRVTP